MIHLFRLGMYAGCVVFIIRSWSSDRMRMMFGWLAGGALLDRHSGTRVASRAHASHSHADCWAIAAPSSDEWEIAEPFTLYSRGPPHPANG